MNDFDRKTRGELNNWMLLRRKIANSTKVITNETMAQQEERVEKLLGNFEDFCLYYFPHYCQSPFGWFHKEAADKIINDPTIFAILEWHREAAKSVFVDVLMPLYLKAKGELTGLMIASANQDKAIGLLGDVQAELMENKRYQADFGQQYSLGDWQSGEFVTSDGIGWWAFGRGQSPRGTRQNEKRPNYGVIDDIDDSVITKNEQRVKEIVDWILTDFYAALSIQGARLIVAGNRIHKKSILAHMVGDITEDDPKHEGRYHCKVFAIEDPKTHAESTIEAGGQPAWSERYSIEMLQDKFTKMGYRGTQREFFHKHIIDGHIFKADDIYWSTPEDRLHDWQTLVYEKMITYVDPSFKDSKKNDYKAIVLLGKQRNSKYIDILWAWVRQATVASMVAAHYDIDEEIQEWDQVCPHYIEANFMQDMLIDDYEKEGMERGYQLPIRADKRSKPDKTGRIENLSPLFERGLIRWNSQHRKTTDMQTLKDQFLGFPMDHDDGPDAVEGAIWMLNRQERSQRTGYRQGKYRSNPSRTL